MSVGAGLPAADLTRRRKWGRAILPRCEVFGACVTRWSQVVRFCVSDGIPKRSLGVALVIGTVLNLINQGDALLGHHPIHWSKLLLTYAVPYVVATYGAVSHRMRSERTRHQSQVAASQASAAADRDQETA